FNIKNSSVLFALESSSNIDHKHISQKNRYEIAFSTAKTAINIALENNKDAELVRLLKDFIAASQKKHEDDINEAKESISAEDYDSKQNQNTGKIISLQQYLINQITSSNVTKIHGAPCKRRIKAVIEISKRNVFNEITNTVQEADYNETSSK
ncbi:7547_t:CDS:2, partial [Gigaspora margarita]